MERIHHINYHSAAPGMLNALLVIALDPRLSAYLAQHDPMALAQIDQAIVDADPDHIPPTVEARWLARSAEYVVGFRGEE